MYTSELVTELLLYSYTFYRLCQGFMSVQREKSTAVVKNYCFLRTEQKTPLVLFEVCFINKFRIQNVFSYFSIDNRAVL